ncbi:MAG: transcription-repair coupling factor [Actinobacteria bacterium]|nr:transcription-repair coupling factor [Actinomycetota bacterium]
MFINNFNKEELWLDFIEKYKNSHKANLIADESIWPFLIGSFLNEFQFPLLVLTSTLDRASELSMELNPLVGGVQILFYPTIGRGSFLKTKSAAGIENLSARLEVFKKIMEYRDGEKPFIIILTSSSIIDLIPKSKINRQNSIVIKSKESLNRDELISKLVNTGYERVNKVFDKGEFSAKGDIIDIFDVTAEKPVRIDLMDENVEKIIIYDVDSQQSAGSLESISIFPNLNPWEAPGEAVILQNEQFNQSEEMVSIFQIAKEYIKEFGFIVCDPLEVNLKIKSDIDMLIKSVDFEDDENLKMADIQLNSVILKKDFAENDSFDYRLNITSSFLEADKEGAFVFEGISRQKKSLGNSEIFIQNLKKDLKKKKITIISLESQKRRAKVTEILLDSSISFKNYTSGKSSGNDSQCTDVIDFFTLNHAVVNMIDSKLFRGYESKSTSLYGELDIYEQLEYSQDSMEAVIEKDYEDFSPGDYIVHKTHGIGKYLEIVSEQIGDSKKEYFLIEYANNDRLYVPAWQSDRIHKYIGDKNPTITALNPKQWENLKRKARTSVHKLAIDLSSLYAERNLKEGFSFTQDDVWQKEMEDLFPFSETADQLKAIDYVKTVMQDSKPMDVLLCGDVGFGKTEIAIRAAFKAIENGKQVLMLVPTTILADQHYRTFSERYKNFPVIVEVISRFRSKKSQNEILKNFKDGRIDMLIGTHRLLSNDIRPNDLGLVIVDEEQRFGVNSKERIKLLKKEVDVLTLSATPIPRTLYMSLTGIRDIILIETHPVGRVPIETFVGEKDNLVIKMAVEREIKRGGQVYYVFNRIAGLQEKKYRLQILIPDASIAVTHGRMEGEEIEKIMQDFLNKKYDILLTTSIIESGMDISNVNTLIVEDSHRFGLAQLYQLRGRVGRSSEKAYAYFFYPDRMHLNFQSFQRLKTLSDYTELGSGYKVAMKDLEIRGAGELLGARQHGHINSVGFDMYCQIIKEEVEKLKGIAVEEDINVHIELPVSAYIPKNYIKNEKERVNIYKALGSAKSDEDIKRIASGIADRFGNVPKPVKNLINIAIIKNILKKAKIEKIIYNSSRGIFLKKIMMSAANAVKMSDKNPNLVYLPRSGEVLIKNPVKNLDLDLVLSTLSDIIGFI